MPAAPYTEEYSSWPHTSFIVTVITFIAKFSAVRPAIAALEDYIFSITIEEWL